MKRFGTTYGGFYYPENLDGLDENSIIYCIGGTFGFLMFIIVFCLRNKQ